MNGAELWQKTLNECLLFHAVSRLLAALHGAKGQVGMPRKVQTSIFVLLGGYLRRCLVKLLLFGKGTPRPPFRSLSHGPAGPPCKVVCNTKKA
jgi:hypothetical protein